MPKTNEKNIHEGHRQRLTELVHKAGLENLSQVQQMEFILFYIFPRGDVNPLAHRLLDKFGAIAHVFDADINDLQTVHGIGPRAAMMLTKIPEIFNIYTDCYLDKRISADDYSKIYDYSEQILRFKNTEELYIVGLNSLGKIISKRKLASGSINMVGVSPIIISNYLASSRAVMVFLTHNHPGESAQPSQQDEKATEFFQNICETLGCQYIDHVVVGDDGVYSFHSNRLVRKFA